MNGCSGNTEKNVHLVRGSDARGVVIPSNIASIRGLTLHCFSNAAFRNMRRPKTQPSGPGIQPRQERVTGTHSESRLSPTQTSQDSQSRSASRSRKKSRCRRWHTYGDRKTSAKTGMSNMELPSSYQIELPFGAYMKVEMTLQCEHECEKNIIEHKRNGVADVVCALCAVISIFIYANREPALCCTQPLPFPNWAPPNFFLFLKEKIVSFFSRNTFSFLFHS